MIMCQIRNIRVTGHSPCLYHVSRTQVLHADVLLPLLDNVAVVKAQWEAVGERVAGIVAQIAMWKQHYHACEDHLIGMVNTLQELYEMMRQCQPGQAFTFQLTHPDLSSTVKSALEEELTHRINHTIWKLSTGDARVRYRARAFCVMSGCVGARALCLSMPISEAGSAASSSAHPGTCPLSCFSTHTSKTSSYSDIVPTPNDLCSVST